MCTQSRKPEQQYHLVLTVIQGIQISQHNHCYSNATAVSPVLISFGFCSQSVHQEDRNDLGPSRSKYREKKKFTSIKPNIPFLEALVPLTCSSFAPV